MPRETMTGKKNKYDSKHTSKKARFPMRTHPINKDLLPHCNEYFADFDFQIMMFIIVIVMAITMTLVKFIMPDSVVSQTNLTYYLIIMTLLL